MREKMSMQSRYQIHIYFNDVEYIAAVPELEGCFGRGKSYSEALTNAEKIITEWVFDAINAGRAPPEPSKDFVLRPPVRMVKDSSAAPVLRRLHQRYGNLTSRQLMEKIGLTGDHAVTPSAFSAAASGKGARFVRLAIALALNEMPSTLWPHLSPVIRQRDDECMPLDE